MKNVFGKKKKKKRYKHSYRYRDYLGWPEVVTQWLGLFSFIIDIRVFKTILTYVENITGIQTGGILMGSSDSQVIKALDFTNRM
jgi:hypothetical protein